MSNPYFVQSAQNTTQSVAAASISATLGVASAIGNLIIVVAGAFSASLTIAISDSNGNTYTSLGLLTQTSCTFEIWYAINNSSTAPLTVTATPSATAISDIAVNEFAFANVFDSSANASGVGNSQDSGPTATRNYNEILFGFTANGTGAISVYTPGTGWNQTAGINGNTGVGGFSLTLATQYSFAQTPGNYDSTSSTIMQKSSTNNWISFVAAFYFSGPPVAEDSGWIPPVIIPTPSTTLVF